MAVKIYTLLPHTESSAKVYVQVNPQQRMQLKKRPIEHAFSRVTFTDRDGKNKTIRLKLSTDEIYQDAQIKEKMIPANEKFTMAERDALRFKDAVLATANETIQKFLEASPQWDGFWKPDEKGRVGSCFDVKRPLYTIHSEENILDDEDKAFMKRLKAANKIAAINDVKGGQELMYRLNGSFFKAPDKIQKIRAELIRWLDDASDEMIDNLLKDSVNIDERVEVLIGKAINYGIISFDRVVDQVVKITNNKVANLKQISSEHSPEERKRYFSEFLTSEDGKLLIVDLEKDIKKAEQKLEPVN